MIEIVELNQLQSVLLRLLDQEALELCLNQKEKVLLVPFVMNDGVESYYRFEGCRVQGALDEVGNEGEKLEEHNLNQVSVQLVTSDNKKGFIIRQASGNIVSIWFQDVKKITKCYQYHTIGHGWRRTKGEEVFRRLVNLICVIHDKRTFLGEEYCNELELQLADLAEFPPLLDFSPIDQSIFDWYPQSLEGIEAAKWLINKAKQEKLLCEIDTYETLFNKRKDVTKRVKRIASLLRQNRSVWDELEILIEKASMIWEPRNYDDETEKKLEMHREQVILNYKKDGFEGEFPKMTSMGTGVVAQIKFVEQLPFTVMEEEKFYHRIFSVAMDQNGDVLRWKEESANLL